MDAANDEDPAGRDAREGVLRIPVGAERVVVGKAEVERVGARVSVRTETAKVPVSEELRTETVEVERVPVDRIVAEPPAARVEDGITIVPVVEEVLVRQFRIVEEVRLIPRVGTTVHEETVTLRRQEAVVETAPDDAPPVGDPADGGPS
jgi:stress response protein YsnF